MEIDSKRPCFPSRVIITAGMPYGNKDLHFGHIGGYFVQADVFARFLRDRIGKENVLFVSGTDCYGSPIVETHRTLVEKGEFSGTIDEFVRYIHGLQREVLDAYQINPDLYGASSFGDTGSLHKQICTDLFLLLHKHGCLTKLTTPQFYDPEIGAFLNGRQVTGQCPIDGCTSERGYADECSLGHQYAPEDLLNPKSVLTGKVPEFRNVTNWYFQLPAFREKMVAWVKSLEALPGSRHFVLRSISEFFEPPTIHVKKEHMELVEKIQDQLPLFTQSEGRSKSMRLVFENLAAREQACKVLTANTIRYRTGKALVPFRLSGNIDWGLPIPDLEGAENLTFWVWPESLWAPISFTAAYLQRQGKNTEDWKEWWTKKDAHVYQFIGEDNVYFYGIAEMAMFMAMQEAKEPSIDPPEGEIQLPELIVDNHILFLDKKASSSSDIKPPMARDLLNYYTSDQLRAHFFSLDLGKRSVSFQPKPLNPKANDRDGDPVMKEGNLLSNVFNRAVRSCFYTAQKFYNNKLPVQAVSTQVMEDARQAILCFEMSMYRHEFNAAITVADNYIRAINKFWEKNMRELKENDNDTLRKQTLVDTFHMVRVAAVLMHSIAPAGTEMIREYLKVSGDFWSWEHIFEPLTAFLTDPVQHEFKFLEPRVDFFPKHPSQLRNME